MSKEQKLKLTLTLEIGAISCLFFKNYYLSLLAFYLSHLLASLLIAPVLYMTLPKRYKGPKIIPILFFTALSVSLSILGVLFLFILTVVLLRKKIKLKEAFEALPFDEIVREGTKFQRRMFGESQLVNLLKTETLPPEARLKALITASNLNTPGSLTLIKDCISDPQDELRLFAFSVVDRIEKNISRQISAVLNRLREAKKEEKPQLYKNLAMLYWDIVYFNSGDEKYQVFALGEALKYARLAYEKIGDDASLLTLLGRICLRKGEMQMAKDYLLKALELGTQKEKVVSYLAEIFYREREFAMVKKLLTETPSLRFIFLMYPVMTLWVEKDG